MAAPFPQTPPPPRPLFVQPPCAPRSPAGARSRLPPPPLLLRPPLRWWSAAPRAARSRAIPAARRRARCGRAPACCAAARSDHAATPARAAEDAPPPAHKPTPPTRQADSRTVALTFGTLLFAVANRVAYKIQISGAMSQYTLFICILTAMCYVCIYFPVLLFRVFTRKVGLSQVRAATSSHLWLFSTVGLLEAVTLTLQMRAATRIPGSLLAILGQTVLPFNMIASALVLRRRFRMSQILGVIGVLAGVLLSLSPVFGSAKFGGPDVFFNSVLYGCSSLFIAFAIVLKEVALNGWPRPQNAADSRRTELHAGEHNGNPDKAPNKEHDENPDKALSKASGRPMTFDVFVVNSFSSLMQSVATVVLLPITLFLAPVAGGGMAHVRTGLQMLFRAKYMPWLTLLYITCNVIFNVCALTLLNQASSTVVLISTIASVPLVSLVFCLPLPMLTPSPFSWITCLGLLVVMFGVCVYNIAPAPRRS